MDGFLLWFAMAWAWMFAQIDGLVGVVAFVTLSALSSIGFYYLFKCVHAWRQRRRATVTHKAQLSIIRQCEEVAAAVWWDSDESEVNA